MHNRRHSEIDGLRIGYTYTTKVGPSLDEQRAAQIAAGVSPERIYADDFTPARKPRHWLPLFVRALRPGDTAVLPGLDVLGSNRTEAVKVLRQLGAPSAMRCRPPFVQAVEA